MMSAATARLVLRQVVSSRVFVGTHLCLWPWLLYSGLQSTGDWNSKLFKVGLYSSFVALYLGASVLSAEYESRNSEVLFLRGIPAATLYWTRLVTLSSLGIVLVSVAGGLLSLWGVLSARGCVMMLYGFLHVLLTFSLCFFFGSFVRGYVNALLAFLFELLSGFLVGAASSGRPVWAVVLAPSWHIGAIGRAAQVEWHNLSHVIPVLVYCFLSAWLGMVIYHKFSSRLLAP